MAIDSDTVGEVIVEPLRRTFQHLFDSTPGCPTACVDPRIASYAREIDDDRDGIVTTTEVEDSETLRFWTQPDVDLLSAVEGEGTAYWPRHDRVTDSLSLGIAAHAVPVTIEP